MCKECIDCKKKVVLCHSGCDEYKDYRAKLDSRKRPDEQINAYKIEKFKRWRGQR